jgi:uncharacterized protein YxeA
MIKEIITYGLILIISIIISFGIFGAFDNDRDNPFKNK